MTMAFLNNNLDYMVFGLLGLMSFFMLWFVIERYFYYELGTKPERKVAGS